MAKTTYFAVQCFEIGQRGKIVAGDVLPATGEEHAIRMAYRLEPKLAGVVAFSQGADAELGDYDDPVILKALGVVPDDIAELSAAA
ncbi:hypothetical protein BH10PSE7_BH10PSE7_15160 [soil metagenome]